MCYTIKIQPLEMLKLKSLKYNNKILVISEVKTGLDRKIPYL